ncbi:MAG: glycosyltransferase [Xanthobacteraceae bacterium]|nr:glycosyltransferase [Xanthobacteraceae bacterium]
MIPKIIHQTWKTAEIPAQWVAFRQSWRDLHPSWQYRLWTDGDLARLVDESFPELRDLFHGYNTPIMRSDLGRYLVLQRFGGVYADLDSEAVASFDCLTDMKVPVFGVEPSTHASLEPARARGFRCVVGNAVMASPAGHPFWAHLLSVISRCRSASGPLDATGPYVLTAAVESFAPADDAPRVLPAHVFAAVDNAGRSVPTGDDALPPLARHHWHGTWWRPQLAAAAPPRRPRAAARTAAWWRDRLVGPILDWRFRRAVDRRLLDRANLSGRHVLIAIPVRDTAATLGDLLEAILRLDHPRDQLSLAFLEGDSMDSSLAILERFVAEHGGEFRSVKLIQRAFGQHFPSPRWGRPHQRGRRSHIAHVRNVLLAEALADEDWVFWVDADIIAMPPTIIGDLLATGAPIAHANAVFAPGGQSFDGNAWLVERAVSLDDLANYVLGGIYQPPPGHKRLYLADLRYRDTVVLDSVGGTALMVHADLHRAGLAFPERPYRWLIETEGFAAAAGDLGLMAVGLPNLEVIHAQERLAPVLDADVRERREIGAFPHGDASWQAVVDFLRRRFGDAARLLGPAEFINELPGTFPYDVARHIELDALDAVAVHKGQLDRIDRGVCLRLADSGIPLYGNDVFVVFAPRGPKPWRTIGRRHFPSFHDQIADATPWAPKFPQTHSEFAGPTTVILMTTFNRPDRLRASLQSIAALKAPTLVVDDGSDPRFAADYAAVFSEFGVRVLRLPDNRGLPAALNAGLSYWLADPNVEWISYLQDDVEVRPDLLSVLAAVQDPTDHPLLTGRLDPLHTVFGEIAVNGQRVFLQRMCPAVHQHAHRDYWTKQLPIPTPYFQAPKHWPGVPQRGSDEDWWFAQWSPHSVVKQGKYVAVLPGLVRTTTSRAADSTWRNAGIEDPPLASR